MLDMNDPASIRQWLEAIRANHPQGWKEKVVSLTNDMSYSEHQRYLIREAAAQIIREERSTSISQSIQSHKQTLDELAKR